MLTNTDIKATFSDVKKSPCATNKLDYFSMQRDTSHRVSLSLIVYSFTSQKKCLQIPYIFLSFKGNTIWTCGVGLVISLCSINFICQKSIHRFLIIFFWVMEDIVLIEIMKKKVGVTVLVQEKRSIYLFTELSLIEISYVLYAHPLMCAR